MTRLIDADALKAVFEEKSSEAVCGAELCKAIISRIDDAQTVDAVPVIRCKDCTNSDPWYADERRCFLWSENGIAVFDDGFCNYAERKEE